VSKVQLHRHSIHEASVVSANVKGPSKKWKKLSYKDEITIPIQRDGHRIILEPEYLRQEQARVQQEELPYFRNLIQAAEGKSRLVAYIRVSDICLSRSRR